MTMRHRAVIIGAAGILCGAPAVHAQHPGNPPGGGMMMPAMDSLDRRLDSLVGRMNRAAGNQKITAMAAVINELVAQRKAMHSHMQQAESHMQQMMDRPRSPDSGQ